LFVEDALKWVETQRDRPFFLYLSLTIPHANNEARAEGMEVPDLGQYADTDWPTPQKGHAAMISRMDRDVGRLMALLQRLGLDERTIVFFSSDNGPHREGGNDPEFNDSNGPLRGLKRDLYEGGIRVPFIVRWPGHIPAGRVSDHVTWFADFLPTAAELAGVQAPRGLDGVSLVPTLLGRQRDQRQSRYLYWEFYERPSKQAIRQGDWKAVAVPFGGPIQLFNLRDDPGEEHDIAAEHPRIVRRLRRLMNEAHVPSPDWKLPLDVGRAGEASPVR
jgi:arylsulfatase A-like enzyme